LLRVAPAEEAFRRAQVELFAPGLAGDRADFAETDLERVRLPEGRSELQPHRFALVHRQHHTAALAPFVRNARGVVVDAAEREAGEAGRERVALAVVGDAEGALEADGHVADAERVVV